MRPHRNRDIKKEAVAPMSGGIVVTAGLLI
jgi:hypothetical protein